MDGLRRLACTLLVACLVGLGCSREEPPPPPLATATSGSDAAGELSAQGSVSSAGEPACPDYVPQGCSVLDTMTALPQPVDTCFVIQEGGATPYIYDSVNIVSGGGLYFVEDPTETIDFQVKSLLVEQGGVFQAGSASCPFGAQQGKLEIGIYGDDPSMQATVASPPPGIDCVGGATGSCFPAGIDPSQGSFYCTVADSDSPCSATTPPANDPGNALLEPYQALNFDPTPFGYKTLAVSYGGSLRLFGYKGALPLQDPGFAGAFDVSIDAEGGQHCVVPTPAESTLDVAEEKAWAKLTGSSWARLDASEETNDPAPLTLLTLDREVSAWEIGDQISIGTTDWYPGHTELRELIDVQTISTAGGPRTQLTVDLLEYPHFTEILDTQALEQAGASYTAPVNRSAADLRAAVGLLSRSIQIRSLGTNAVSGPQAPGFPAVDDCLKDNSTDDCYFGAHVIARQGFREFQVQGVEFKQLGQGGRIGHYPVHFHLSKDTSYTEGKAFLKDSSVWDSMTRFVTVHGTLGVNVSRNVGYLSLGHGYYLEDGSEIGNLLCHNLGMSARGALDEYFDAQADPSAWCGSGPPPSARYVPPILDGSSPTPQLAAAPNLFTGSDTYMPVMFWTMNTYNEFVGNKAVGVHGFGSCFWLLGSGVSGPSANLNFDGFAGYNSTSMGVQAPLLRFRGNACTTATYALPASAELSPAGIGEGPATGYTATKNPYLFQPGGSPKTVQQLQGEYDRPAVTGNFQPIQPNAANQTNCSQATTSTSVLQQNTESCVTTIVDRFTTSFNWAERNFGSIWFRPWFYLLMNAAVTDQLFGGVTMVSAGSWVQTPPGYFSLVKNGLFAGTTQHGGSPFASRAGPLFEVTAQTDLDFYDACGLSRDGSPVRGYTTCNLFKEGVGFWQGGLQPKRLINIYDGPHFADGNTFINVGAWECDPQPCEGKADGECVQSLPCGIYSGTLQPSPSAAGGPIDPHKMVVQDAAIGWKQPNGFYYPPAFTYRASSFFKTLPPEVDPVNPLNQCFSFGPDDGFSMPHFLDGDCRHNVIDRTHPYIAGNMLALRGAATPHSPGPDWVPNTTPIDFSTILIDLDGTLTGALGTVEGYAEPRPTTSLSRNAFFDAPAQSDECLSFGLQTSPYEFVTSVIAPIADSPATMSETHVEPSVWTSPNGEPNNPSAPLVAIYRQWETAKDRASSVCEQVCVEDPDTPGTFQYGCDRANFMVGPNIGQSPYLTLSEAPSISTANQPGLTYYIDTSGGTQSAGTTLQRDDCVTGLTRDMFVAPFEKNQSYVLYTLFAKNDSRTSYQVHVGDPVQGMEPEVQGRYVRVKPHLHGSGSPTTFDSLRTVVDDPCVPGSAGWCAALPVPTVSGGILELSLDQSGIAADYELALHADYERCMPRDFCYYDETATPPRCEPCLNDPSKCIRQDDFLAVDLASMNQSDASGAKPLDIVCQDWVSFVGGTLQNDPGEFSLPDCPAEGCLGFAFTLPDTFTGDKTYADVGGPLANCYAESAWENDALDERMDAGTPADPLCGEPRQQTAADYCQDAPRAALFALGDSFVRPGGRHLNEGANLLLSVGFHRHRALVGFESASIDAFLAGKELTRATLVLSVADSRGLPRRGREFDAHPLLQTFTEGSGLHLNTPMESRVQNDDDGVTWICPNDDDPSDGSSLDCGQEWVSEGGHFSAASAEAALHALDMPEIISWDVTEDVLQGVHQWIVRARNERLSGTVRYHSREGAELLGRPELAPMLLLE